MEQYISTRCWKASFPTASFGMRTLSLAQPKSKGESILMLHHRNKKAPEWVPFLWWSIFKYKRIVKKTSPNMVSFFVKLNSATVGYLNLIRIYI